MRAIDGWLEAEEADLLVAAATRAADLLPAGFPIVEVGCFCGRATVVLASVMKSRAPESRVYAIDPHDGRVGALDQGLQNFGPTLERFRRNIRAMDWTKMSRPLHRVQRPCRGTGRLASS